MGAYAQPESRCYNRTQSLPYIIAEIGFNHEGNLDVAVEMIHAAARAGANAVKFQTLWAEDIALPSSPYFEDLRASEMNLEQHQQLAQAATEAAVACLISAGISFWEPGTGVRRP